MTMQNGLAIRPNQEIRKYNQNRGREIPHLSKHAVWEIAEKAEELAVRGKTGMRNNLLVRTLFDTACRVSEIVGDPETGHTGIRYHDLILSEQGTSLRIPHSKGGKDNREVAISQSIYNEIMVYLLNHYQIGIEEPDRTIFNIGRKRVWQFIDQAIKALPHINKPDGVGACHFLRHSGAIHRLAVTKNPKAVQDQLGHTSLDMTLNYVKTLSSKESLAINQSYDVSEGYD